MLFLRVDAGKIEKRQDIIAVEEPIHILVNQEHYATILCTPSHMTELVIGNLISEGLIDSLDEIKEINAKEDGEFHVTLRSEMSLQARLAVFPSFKRLILSACGSSENWPLSKLIDRINLPNVEVKDRIEAKTILEATRELNYLATTFKKTGGVHAAALYLREGELVSFSEDVGRHNAVDKVIGLGAIKKCDFKESFLVSTGRLSGDIVLKVARVGIPLIASLSSALNSGVEVAKKTGVTIIGFVRGQRMNIYSYPERIVIKESLKE